ncbi:hypothetical protein PHET_04255 [Paragonimus heterotremus]|uniref:Uncharacterized protein n=1 Tax=Paragonimus heterotremus TaxID=100268 RepID=A0A8J4TMW8_9TREM|nr:hypothetical protein PHET_04255 [Paragonimus heterotremus]
MPTTVGLLDPPLGRFRLALVQFFALLVALPTETGLAEGLVKVGVVNTLLELFERYAYNTLLHQAAINFLLGVFTHARVVDTNRANRKDQKDIASDTNITTSTPTGGNPSDPKANSITSESPSSVASKETRMDVDTDVISSAQLKSSEKPTATLLDDAFTTIMKDNGLIDWCLRLSPLSANLPSKNNMGPVNAPKPRPKPGYAGHLWQLANCIEDARKGSRSDFVARVFQELTPASLTSWDAFVAGDLSNINAQQVPDDLSDVKPSQGSNLVSLLAPNDLMGNLLSQSGGLFNVGSGLMNSGKFSLFLAPLVFGNQSGCKQNVISDAARLDLSGILDDTDFGQTNLSTIESSPGEPRSTNMWIDDETNEDCEANARFSDSKFSQFADNETNSGFHRARVEDLSSDESEPGEDDDADDEDDEEEDLKSPAVIKQQRSAVTPPAPVIKLSQPSLSPLPTELSSDSVLEAVSDSSTPWDSALNVEPSQPATDPGGWAKFDDQPIMDPNQAKESLVSPSSDAFSLCQTVNGFNGSTSASTALSSSGSDSAKINQTGPSKNCPSIAPSDALQLQQQ